MQRNIIVLDEYQSAYPAVQVQRIPCCSVTDRSGHHEYTWHAIMSGTEQRWNVARVGSAAQQAWSTVGPAAQR
jgi:hypothetical protein